MVIIHLILLGARYLFSTLPVPAVRENTLIGTGKFRAFCDILW